MGINSTRGEAFTLMYVSLEGVALPSIETSPIWDENE